VAALLALVVLSVVGGASGIFVKYLDAKEQDSLLLSATLQSQLATLAAYRKSLIHECVTGQRRSF